jgi:hypothetical protein
MGPQELWGHHGFGAHAGPAPGAVDSDTEEANLDWRGAGTETLMLKPGSCGTVFSFRCHFSSSGRNTNPFCVLCLTIYGFLSSWAEMPTGTQHCAWDSSLLCDTGSS